MECFMINAIGKCDRGVWHRIHGSLPMSGEMPRGYIDYHGVAIDQ